MGEELRWEFGQMANVHSITKHAVCSPGAQSRQRQEYRGYHLGGEPYFLQREKRKKTNRRWRIVSVVCEERIYSCSRGALLLFPSLVGSHGAETQGADAGDVKQRNLKLSLAHLSLEILTKACRFVGVDVQVQKSTPEQRKINIALAIKNTVLVIALFNKTSQNQP